MENKTYNGNFYKVSNNNDNWVWSLEKTSAKKGLEGACWEGYEAVGFKNKNGKKVPNCVPKKSSSEEQLDKEAGKSPAWQRSEGKNEKGGLNEKGRKSYKKENPGSKLSAPVTEKKPEGKRKKRKDSFCSRMCGMKKKLTGTDKKKDPDSRINKSLRKWRCKCSSSNSGNFYKIASNDDVWVWKV